MEPIDYRYALVRRWWLLPILAVICAVIAVLVPVSGKSARSQFEATAIIGIPPGGKNSTGGAAVSPQEVLFYAANEQVITSAAKSIGLKKTANLQGLVSVATPKSSGKAAKGASLLPPGSLSVSVKQPTAVRSAKLTNAYVNSLFTYINSQLAANQTAQGQADIQQANNIETQLNTVDAQIATTNCGTASTTSYTGSGQAASLLASFASFQVGTTGAPPAVLVSAGPASSAPSPSDSSPPSDNSPAKTAPP
ncbi:MAG TPA: hypothetical protein VEJ87_08835, partial [Acidimicrobiales bacterium]|nr:hypothetical protein [Acidimicrobiales bacterium]